MTVAYRKHIFKRLNIGHYRKPSNILVDDAQQTFLDMNIHICGRDKWRGVTLSKILRELFLFL